MEDADFVMGCLSLGNQGLASTRTESSAQANADGYVDDIFTDDSDSDGDPVSLVNYIRSLGAIPIVTLVYPSRSYDTMHCRTAIESNIVQQSLGVPTINHMGATNAGNAFDGDDCTWASSTNAPIDAEYDSRHPNGVGHGENFYAFPLDLPFALASGIPFPVRPGGDSSYTVSGNDGPVVYTPQHAIHSYTMQFGFRTGGDGSLATIDVGSAGFVSPTTQGGRVQLIAEDGSAALQSTGTAADG